jgi:hypothetical protein
LLFGLGRPVGDTCWGFSTGETGNQDVAGVTVNQAELRRAAQFVNFSGAELAHEVMRISSETF